MVGVYGMTITYLPLRLCDQAEAADVPPPAWKLRVERGTNWRPSWLTEIASRGLGLGPQTVEPYG